MPDTLISTEALTDRRPANSTADRSVKDLWNAHRKAWKAYSAAMDAEDDAMARALPHLPPRPAFDEALIGELMDEGALSLEEAKVLRTALHGWEAACEAVKDAHGLREAEAALKAAEQRYAAAEDAFVAAPVRSPADAVLKLRFALDDMSSEARSDAPAARALRTALQGLQKLN